MPDKTLIQPCWRDELGPIYPRNTGPGAPSLTALGAPNTALRVLTFTPADWLPQDWQINHDVRIPAAGNIVLKLHAHFTFAATPANGATVIWECEMIGAKPTACTTSKPAGVVAYASLGTITGPTYVCDGTEGLEHYVQALGDITIPAANYAASYDIIATTRLKSTATVAAGKAVLRWVDIHKLVEQIGTATEFA